MTAPPIRLPSNQVRGLVHDLRQAIAAGLADAEGYMPLIRCFERIGRHVRYVTAGPPDDHLTLADVQGDLGRIVAHSSAEYRRMKALFELIVDARNHAVHQGGVARQLRAWGVTYALALQEGLMANLKEVRAEDLMVTGVVVAEPWYLLRDVRTAMLANSFSWIPVRLDGVWWLIQDLAIASLLINVSAADRRAALDRRVEDARQRLRKARTILPDVRRSELPLADDPLLVVDTENRLLGIVTAYDLL
jgi:CBS domain-containing protein